VVECTKYLGLNGNMDGIIVVLAEGRSKHAFQFQPREISMTVLEIESHLIEVHVLKIKQICFEVT